ncbi:dienelactone hydrolase family protein [Sphingomonas astaxanthinifaciens]|uniref:Carboxymethylenebutenolidase n=1 Tax=Sphingomonas astaxanthinifaciens DSM 22298 TaxID=1123267 RepID=A0ABQ5Z283_9SPHN|nr:dienelactone hydrolase family protein [Sphingomonas astaxanthinifaciens]GLR46874.1 carboxymethylenebutenolidase [Sphingomonas astaxanthinifaciens DSM 22298]
MCETDKGRFIVDTDMTRRGLMIGLAGTAAATGLPGFAAAAGSVVESDVLVPTPDGQADAALFHPAGKGRWPAVLIWTDILGLRPVFREMGRRLAAQGHVVLVPNPYYRAKKAPVVSGSVDFSDRAAMKPVMEYRAALTDERIDSDARAYLAFLDRQKATDRARGAGVQGYCMGGPFTFRTAAAVPGRIRAAASFHGGGLVTDKPNSPHLLLPRTRADFLVAIAQNDDARQPDAKATLRTAFAQAKRRAEIEVYPADHGWCVGGSQAYDEAAAEKAWARLTSLYKARLA